MHILVILARLLLPVLACCLAQQRLQGAPRRDWRAACSRPVLAAGAAVSLAANLAAWAAPRVLPLTTYTQYEACLLVALVTAAGVWLVVPLARRQSTLPRQLLETACAVCLAAAFYSCLTYGQTHIHCDTATATQLAREQLRTGQLFPASWCYANGDLWVLSPNLIVLPLTLLLTDQPLARALASAISVAIAVWALRYHSRRQLGDASWLIAAPLFTVGLFGAMDMILWQAAYVSFVPKFLLLAVWAGDLWTSPDARRRRVSAAALAVLLALCCLEGVRNLAEMTLPLLGAFAVMFYRENRTRPLADCRKGFFAALRGMAAVLAGSAAGMGAYLAVTASLSMNSTDANSLTMSGSVNVIWECIVEALKNCLRIFGYTTAQSAFSLDGIRNLCAVALCVLVVFVLPVLQLRRFDGESRPVQFFLALGGVHNLLMLVMAVLFAKTADRYLLTYVYVCLIVSAHYVTKYCLPKADLRGLVWSAGTAAALAVCCVAVVSLSAGWDAALAQQRLVGRALTDAGLTRGYASYTYSFMNYVYSDCRAEVAALDITEEGTAPRLWLVSESWYDPADFAGPTYLMLDPKEQTLAAENGTLDALGAPAASFAIEGTQLTVYVYDYNIMQVLNPAGT